jgi:hypothetical protein
VGQKVKKRGKNGRWAFPWSKKTAQAAVTSQAEFPCSPERSLLAHCGCYRPPDQTAYRSSKRFTVTGSRNRHLLGADSERKVGLWLGFQASPTAFAFSAAARHTCSTPELFAPDVRRGIQNWLC